MSVAEIANAAGVFPNQVTYHFGSKDSLIVHAAFLGLLHDTRRMERIGRQAPDAATFRRNIARAVLSLPSLPSVARALAAGISKPELAPVVDQHLQLLFRQSERYVSQLIDRRGWKARRSLDVEARTFWSTALGAVLLVRAGAHGTNADLDLAGALTIHDDSEQPAGSAACAAVHGGDARGCRATTTLSRSADAVAEERHLSRLEQGGKNASNR